jgi:hypothetical protein
MVLTLGLPAHASSVMSDENSVSAIWHVQQLPFDYYSPHTSYSCRALKSRIRAILQAVGAHESMEIAGSCAAHEPVRSARIYISLASPVEATDANVLDATTFQPHERLAARLRGIALPTSTDIERFPASWRRVSLAQLHLKSGDCDLLNDLRSQVFPRLRVRNAAGFECSVSPTRLAPSLKAEALVREGH